MLDNWFLGNPINQRGESSYSTNNQWAYSIDRYKLFCSDLKINNDSINVTTQKTANYKRMVQLTEHTILSGVSYTLSMLAKVNDTSGSVRLRLCTNTYSNIELFAKAILPTDIGDYKLFTVTHTSNQEYSNVGIDLIAFNTISDYFNIDIKAIKLEIGDKQTLAHQDSNGNWVLNDSPPNKVTELLKCQYYLAAYDQHTQFYAIKGSSYTDILTEIPVSMRKWPTIINPDTTILGTLKVAWYNSPTTQVLLRSDTLINESEVISSSGPMYLSTEL